ncbi:MAG: DUF4178 domain-containing protein, partial [Acidobacteria bacterium]|nr:DUF4178 domain-containing protein [Acidobacteriota bacterium]
KRVKLDGRVYTHFQRANATTTYVLGEFPWQVRVGDKVQADDFVSPPYLLSSESVPGETTWSRGEYMAGQQIQAAFGLPGKAEKASGIFANQPSPYSGKVKSIWGRFGLMLVLLACTALVVGFLHRNEKAFDHRYSYASTTQESSFVTPVFELKGRKSGVKIQIDTDLNNDWAFFGLALINEVTGEVFDTGKEIRRAESPG